MSGGGSISGMGTPTLPTLCPIGSTRNLHAFSSPSSLYRNQPSRAPGFEISYLHRLNFLRFQSMPKIDFLNYFFLPVPTFPLTFSNSFTQNQPPRSTVSYCFPGNPRSKKEPTRKLESREEQNTSRETLTPRNYQEKAPPSLGQSRESMINYERVGTS